MGGLLRLVQRGWPAAAPPSPLPAVPNVTVHPSTATSGPTSCYSTWRYIIIIIIIIIIINVKIIVTLSQKNAAGALYKTLCQNLQLTLCNK